MPDAGRQNWNTITRSSFPWERKPSISFNRSFPPTSPIGPGPTSSSSPTTAASTRSTCWSSRRRGSSWSRSRVNPGVLTGDTHTWTWQHDGHHKVVDNPALPGQPEGQETRLAAPAAAGLREVAGPVHRAPDLLLGREPPVPASGQRPVPCVPARPGRTGLASWPP